MFWKRVAVAVALFAVSGTVDFAQARNGGGHHFSGGVRSFSYGGVRPFYGAAIRPSHNIRPFYRPAFAHRGFRHHRFRGAPFVVPGTYPFYGAYGYSYADDCYWLKRQAFFTDSRYWWQRYEACRYGYDY